MATATYTKTGTKATTAAKLDKAVFGVEVTSHQLLKDAYVAYMANGRDNLSVVKTRGLVSGGGKKPWKQKGTGRARFGSSRNPIWRGGGIVFGPTGEENYSKNMNVKAKRLAIRQALSLKADNIKVIEAFAPKDGKSAAAASLLNKIEATGNTLLVVNASDEAVTRATRNLQKVTVVTSGYLNVFDVLNADTIVFEDAALKSATERLSKEAK